MSQVYARQAQVQAASIEASAYPTSDGDSTTDSDSRSPAAASYMHEGLQSPTTGKSKVRNVDEHDANGDDDSDVSNEDLSEEPCKLFPFNFLLPILSTFQSQFPKNLFLL
jgi:hypothetical protein